MGNPVTPGMHVQPGPMSFKVMRPAPGIVVLHFEHTTGATTLLMDDAFAESVRDELSAALGQAGGTPTLVVPTPNVPSDLLRP